MTKPLWLASMLSVVLASVAWAGARTTTFVVINSSGRYASGNLSDVHNTSESDSYVGCETWSTPSLLSGTCFAMSAEGTYASCFTNDPKIISVIQALPSDGFVFFAWDPNGTCSSVYTITTSWSAPKGL